MKTKREKNIVQQVFVNVGPDGKKQSITRYVPKDPTRQHYIRFPKGSGK
jgi:hypothetical protein